MVLISHRYKFIHLRNYKVASSSVEAFFGQFCVDPSMPYYFSDIIDHQISSYGIIGRLNKGVWYNHMSSKEIQTNIGEQMFNDYFKFCVIRNPYDRMVSIYHWSYPYLNTDSLLFGKRNYSKKISFKDFCKYYTKLPYSNDLERILLNGKEVCNYYIRYENLKEDMIILLKKLGITEYRLDDLPYHKSGFRPPDISYQEYYDDETREIVYNKFKIECDAFNYTFK